jgi:aspartyl-tRNA(Asn)/glutamyl-tRNA(Gln) amidotransferase subunit C
MIDKQTVEHVAKLARVDLTEEEINNFSKEFSDILDLFSSLKDVKTENVEPSFHPVELKNVLREDSPEKCLTQEEALKNAEQKEDGFFKGPRSV